MALTRDFKQTVVGRAQRDPRFAQTLLDEATSLLLKGEPEAARLVLRDLVNATIGFEALADQTHKPTKSLHRMLSARGNPSMDSLAAIFHAVSSSIGSGSRKAAIRDAASFEETQETLALLKILASGQQDVAARKVKPVDEVVARLKAKRTTG